MLRLTPFRETEGVKEVLKEEHAYLLADQAQAKFDLSNEARETLRLELFKLDDSSLRALNRQMLRIDTLEQLEIWITDHLPADQR